MKVFLFLIGFVFSISLLSQNGIDNDKAHRRYWYYRTRLINDFMKIGKDQGDCIIAAERNYGARSSTIMKVGPDQMDISNHYIMALALEYKMLTRGGQSTEETVKELWHMLYTINRLDGEANQFWNSNSPSTSYNVTETTSPDGFLIREDVPPDYYSKTNNLYHFNYSMKLSGLTNITPSPSNSIYKGFCGTEYADNLQETKFQEFVAPPSSSTLTLLQRRDHMGVPTDKFHSMLNALLFVIKYIPNSVVYKENNVAQGFQDGVFSIQTEAQRIAERVYKYMRNGFNAPNSWLLQYPDNTASNPHILNVGAFASVYSYPLSRMACNANHGFPYSFANLDCLSSYSDPTSLGPGTVIYNAQATTFGATEDNGVFKAWDHIGSNMPVGPIPIAAAMQANTVHWNIKWADLARIVLHQTDLIVVPETDYTGPINKAPCSGPYNFGSNPIPCDNGGCEFSAQDWLEKPTARGAKCTSCNNTKDPFQGNYPGVDYMLLHNLYYEYQNQLVFDNNYGNTGGVGGGSILTSGSTGNIGSSATSAFFISYYNATTNSINAVTTTACNVLNSISNFFGGNNVCNGTNISTIPTGNGTPYSKTIYIPYNLMDNYDNSVWPKQIYNGPQAPYVPGSGPFSSSNPTSPNNPNNPNSPYNPNNPNGYYSVPSNFIFSGVNTSQAKVGVYQNLTSTSHIYATVSPAATFNTLPSDVRYRAGMEITLLPGFQVDAGSTFHAYIQQYLCNSNSDDWQMRQFNMDSSYIDMAHYETDLVNQMPIHYVDHPLSDSDLSPSNTNQSSDILSNSSDNYSEETAFNELAEQYNEAQLSKDPSKISSVMSNVSIQRFLVTPNPNNGIFKLYVNQISENESFEVSVLNIHGQVIKSFPKFEQNVEIEIDLSQNSKSVYLVKVTSNAGFIKTKKIVVQ